MAILRSQSTRNTVLGILRRHGGQMSAYDIAAQMRGQNPKIAPTTIYRAMNSLIAEGLVHRVESTNAFVACSHTSRHKDNSTIDHESTPSHAGAVLAVCDACGRVEESVVPELAARLLDVAKRAGFVPSRQVMEVQGFCAQCDNASTIGSA